MCFSIEITAFMAALNLGTGLFLTKRGHWLSRTQIFYTFFVMESLQFLQYLVLDDCNHWLNQLATLLSYIHVCFQPLSVNIFLFRHEPNRDVARTVFGLCIVAGVLASLRVPYLGLGRLPPIVRELLPGLPDPALAGTPAVCSWESVCGPQTCTTRGKLHLSWTLPLLPPSYFIPSGFVHFLMFFGPALVVPGVWAAERKAFVVAMMLTGPIATQLASYWAADGEPSWRMEWAGVWCLFAVVQCLLGVAVEGLMGVHQGSMEPGNNGHKRFAALVRAGKLFGGVKGVPVPGTKPAAAGADGRPVPRIDVAASPADSPGDSPSDSPRAVRRTAAATRLKNGR